MTTPKRRITADDNIINYRLIINIIYHNNNDDLPSIRSGGKRGETQY